MLTPSLVSLVIPLPFLAIDHASVGDRATRPGTIRLRNFGSLDFTERGPNPQTGMIGYIRSTVSDVEGNLAIINTPPNLLTSQITRTNTSDIDVRKTYSLLWSLEIEADIQKPDV